MDINICTDEINNDFFNNKCSSELSEELSDMLKSKNSSIKCKQERDLDCLISNCSDSYKYKKNCSKPTKFNSQTDLKLKNDLYKILDLVNNLDCEIKQTKKLCYSLKQDALVKHSHNPTDLDDKVYEYIHCQINQKMDTILDTMNNKFEDIEKRISKLFKGFAATANI